MKSAVSLSALALLLSLQSIAAIPVPFQPYLLFSNWFTVSRVNLDGSNFTELADADVQDVDYHLRLEKLFWNDFTEGSIYQGDLQDAGNAAVIVDQRHQPNGLAVDWVNDRLYFSYNDPDSSLNHPNRLAYYDLTTGEEIEITSTIYQQELAIKPRSPFTLFFDMVVDPVNQKLYWTAGFQLLESSLTGENVKIIHSSFCTIRYIGLSGGSLYFSQEFCNTEGIRSLDLQTLQENTVVEGRGYYNDVAAFADTAYWTGFGRVSSAPTSGEGPVSEVMQNTDHGLALYRGIRVVHPDLQPEL